MKSQSKSAVLAVCAGIVLVLGSAPNRAKADEWDKLTRLTTSQPMQVQDTYLEPGTYVFKLADSSSDRHIVYIYNADQNHLITTIMAIPDDRVVAHGKSGFKMYETPAGYATALRSWYYAGDRYGNEFRYPKNLRRIEVAQATTVTPAPPAAPEPQAEAAPAPQAAVTEPQPQPEPVIAQNEPPAPPPAPAEAPAPAPVPATLPQTASPFPLIGLAGVFMLGLGALLRRCVS